MEGRERVDSLGRNWANDGEYPLALEIIVPIANFEKDIGENGGLTEEFKRFYSSSPSQGGGRRRECAQGLRSARRRAAAESGVSRGKWINGK